MSKGVGDMSTLAGKHQKGHWIMLVQTTRGEKVR